MGAPEVTRARVERLAEAAIEHWDAHEAMFGDGAESDGMRYYFEPMRSAAEVEAIAAAMGTEVSRSHDSGWTRVETEAFGVTFFKLERRG